MQIKSEGLVRRAAAAFENLSPPIPVNDDRLDDVELIHFFTALETLLLFGQTESQV